MAWLTAFIISFLWSSRLTGDSVFQATYCLKFSELGLLKKRPWHKRANYQCYKEISKHCRVFRKWDSWGTSSVVGLKTARSIIASSGKQRISWSENWTWTYMSSARECSLRQFLACSVGIKSSMSQKWPNHWLIITKKKFCTKTRTGVRATPKKTRKLTRASSPTELQ